MQDRPDQRKVQIDLEVLHCASDAMEDATANVKL